MRPAAIFLYILGTGMPLTLLAADPNCQLPWGVWLPVLLVALACWILSVWLDREDDDG